MVHNHDEAGKFMEEAISSLIPEDLRDSATIRHEVLRLSRLVVLGVTKAVAQARIDEATLEEASLLAAELGAEEIVVPAPKEYHPAIALAAAHQPPLTWLTLEFSCYRCAVRTNPSQAHIEKMDFDTLPLEEVVKKVLCTMCADQVRKDSHVPILKFETWFIRMIILRLREEGLTELKKQVLALAKQSQEKKSPTAPQTGVAPKKNEPTGVSTLRASLAERLVGRGTPPQPPPLPTDDLDIPEIAAEDVVEIPPDQPAPTLPTISSQTKVIATSDGDDPRPVKRHKEGQNAYQKRVCAWEKRQNNPSPK